MDLSIVSTKKKANEGVFLHLKNPENWEDFYDITDGKEDLSKPIGLIMLGVDSDVAVKAKHDRINKSITKKQKKSKGDQEETEFSQKSEAEQNEILADCTIGWKNLSLDGSEEFTREAILKVYSDSGWSWLRAQAMAFVDNRANFLEKRVTP